MTFSGSFAFESTILIGGVGLGFGQLSLAVKIEGEGVQEEELMAQAQSVNNGGIGRGDKDKGEKGGVIGEERFGLVSEGFSQVIQSVGMFSRVRFIDFFEVVCSCVFSSRDSSFSL